MRIVIMYLKASRFTAPKPASHAPSGAHVPPVDQLPICPTLLFVPGGATGSSSLAQTTRRTHPALAGAFISDFEAPDRYFLYKWVRATGAVLVYVTYEFAPQAPFPAQACTIVSNRNARRCSHAALSRCVRSLSLTDE